MIHLGMSALLCANCLKSVTILGFLHLQGRTQFYRTSYNRRVMRYMNTLLGDTLYSVDTINEESFFEINL